jgi:uroporphyrinogen-III synthase
MRLLVTRPAADSAALAELLRAQGHETIIDPMLEVRPLDTAAPSLDGVVGLLFTSANGVRAFAAISDRRDLAVYAVGDRTAEAARLSGFGAIESADGDVEALARLIAERCRPADGALLHVSGTVRAGNLAETLSAQGFTVHHAALYEAVAATAIAEPARAAIQDGALDGALFFSPRTAAHFVELIAGAELGESARRLQAWCLSKPVAEALAPLRLAGIHIAAEPTQASLLKAIGRATPDEPGFVLGSPGATRPSALSAPRRGRRSWAGIAAVLLLVIGAAATAPQWLPLIAPLWRRTADTTRPPGRAVPPPSVDIPPPGPAATAESKPEPSEAAAEAEPPTQRLDRLEAAFDALRVNAASSAPKGSVTALQTQMAELSQQIDTLNARPAADPQAVEALLTETKRLAAAMAQLSDRLFPIEARVNLKVAAIRNDRSLVLAAGQIRDALAGSAPFAAPVAVIRAVAPDDAELAQPLTVLEAHAQTGVPSRVLLAQELAALPGKLAEPAPLPPDSGIWARIADRLSRQVKIRRVDDGSGALPPGPDRLVAEAAQALSAGDLAGAVQILRGLEGEGAVTVKPWLDAAQARLDCEQAALALEAAATRRLDQPTDAGAAE